MIRKPSFFSELKRRNVYKVAVAYSVAAWLMAQGAAIVLPTFAAPPWIMQVLLVLLALGLPMSAVLAWAFEITPEGIKRTEEISPNEFSRRGTGRKLVGITTTLAAIAAGLFLFQHWRSKAVHRQPAKESAASAQSQVPAPANSIAVLPFRNLSEEKANAFFAFGIQDEIITALAKISGLKVTSRTSAGHYESSPQNLPQVAQELRVANILEGSVQKAGDRVHINVQLIQAATDEHLWAQSYDRALTDIFSVEAEVAQNVATSLKAALSPEEKVRVETKPTNNAEAYLLYLRGREYQTRPTGLLQDYQTAAELYTRAITLDPDFALAHARLATTLAYTYLNFQPTDEIKRRARMEAETALRLQPDLGEGHLAYGLCLYWTEKEYEAALQELEIARRLRPNDAEIDYFTGAIRRRQGQWAKAVASIELASTRDPRNSLFAREVLLTRWMVRDWSAAARGGDRAVALAPDLPLLTVERSYVDIWARADLGPLKAALAAIPVGVDPDGEVTLAHWDAAMLARDFATAERVVSTASSETLLTPFGTPLPKAYLLGCVALARNDPGAAQPLLEIARPKMETDAAEFPLDAFRQAQLGLLYAFLGRKEDALRQGRRAVEILPESKDAFYGSCLSGLLALIYARTGEADEALHLLEHLLTVPGPVSQVFEGSMTINDLRLRWQWDSLRNDPRFRELVNGPEPRTTYE